jgi:4-hydroxybutyryl-CoA dehydratase/vinylacetyl-CoA-Delta-isomerase
MPTIATGEEYIDSLRGRSLTVYLFGELVDEPVDHPVIRPSVNAVAATYDLASQAPELATVISPLTGERVNRFTHIAGSADDLVMQNKMQRRLGQLTGTCFQRCVGMDAINALHSVTYEIDMANDTPYHERFKRFVTMVQERGFVIGGAMTDVKGDRSKAPHQQDDPDLFVHVSKRNEDGVWIRGAKAHQTGCINSHWLLVMPTMRLGSDDRDYAIVGAVPVDAEGITYIYGRQSCDSRAMEDGDIDAGNAKFGGQEAMVIFDDVFIPWENVFMDGEYDFAAMLVERFTCYHRENASHIKEKLVEMTHLNETIYSTGIASSYQASEMKSGVYLNDDMIANVCKHHVTKMPYEIGRLAQDIAGGLMVTAPSQQDFEHPEIGGVIRKYLKGRKDIDVEDRLRILRLIENMTLGRNAVGYLTESMHGAGSPQAQRIQIKRQMQREFKKQLAKNLAGINSTNAEALADDLSGYMARIFAPTKDDPDI